MRLRTEGNLEYRKDHIRQVMKMTGEETKTGAIDYSLEFTIHHLRSLETARDHPDLTPELADALSTHLAQLSVDRQTRLTVNE